MGRKHGFRGTPVRPASTPSGMGRVFENRGDPLVSPREGREKYGRNLETENPDFDRYFAEGSQRELATRNLRPSQVDVGNAFRKALVRRPTAQELSDQLRERAARRRIALAYKNKQRVVEVKAKTPPEPVPLDNIPATVSASSKKPSREKQYPEGMPNKPGFYDFTSPPLKRGKETIKNGKVYRRK